jgi:3-polyprenyl-4-hydroxybenzoate decarboxylase
LKERTDQIDVIGEMTMKEDAVLRRIRGHKANLDRYARMLSTNLTDLERQYIHRRIAEEHAAMARLEAERLAKSVATAADPATLVAARAAARKLGSGHAA